MFVLLLAALAVLIPALAAPPGAGDGLGPALVQVVAYDAKGLVLAEGDGFFISKDGHVITARRILRGAVRAEVKGAHAYPVTGVILDAVSAGLVRVAVAAKEGGTPAVPLFQTEPRTGESVSVAGGGPIGPIRAIRDVPALGKILRVGGPMPSGAWGMPVLDSRGEAIGIALWQGSASPPTSFVISAESVPLEVTVKAKTLVEWNATASKDFVAAAEPDYIKGLSHLLMDEYEDARDSLRRAVTTNPRYAEAWFHSGFAEAKMGHPKQRIEAYKEAVRVKPDYAAARYSLGVSYALAGEGELAVAEYKALLGIDTALAARLEVLIGFIGHSEHEEESSPAPQRTGKKK